MGHDHGERRKGRDQAAALFFDLKTGLAELFGVLAGALVVGDQGEAPGLQDSYDLVESGQPSGAVIEVVQTEVGDNDIEAGIGEVHLCGGLTDQGTAVGDTFEGEIVQGRGGGVAAHVHVRPDIDSGGVPGAVAGCEALCRSSQQEPASTAYVEDLLVAAPRVHPEHEVAMAKFAYFDVEKKQETFCKQETRYPEEKLRCDDEVAAEM